LIFVAITPLNIKYHSTLLNVPILWVAVFFINNSPVELVDSFTHPVTCSRHKWMIDWSSIIDMQHSTGRLIICYASLESYRLMLNLNCSVAIAL